MRGAPSQTIAGLAASLCIGIAASASAAEFTGLGDFPGGDSISAAFAVSGDGSVVVGYSNSASGSEAFRWTSGGGMVGLGNLPGGDFDGIATDVNRDGSVIVGYSISASGREAFRWTSGGGMVGLGDLPGGPFGSSAEGVSDDGSVVVGTSFSSASFGQEVFRWTAGGGMVGLGYLPGGFDSQAVAVSSDGSVVVGTRATGSLPFAAFRWTSGGGMVDLGSLPYGDGSGRGHAVSSDGSVVVGDNDNAICFFGECLGFNEAFRWTSASGMVGLGPIPWAGAISSSTAFAVSGDGSVVVGRAGDWRPPLNPGRLAFIWDQANGMRSLRDVLVGLGLGPDLSGWINVRPTGLSDDGQTIVGGGINPSGDFEAWIAVLTEPDVTAVPALPTWGFAILAVLLVGVALLLSRREHPAQR